MIINIPTSKDFIESGMDYLNLAWGSTINLLIEFTEAEVEDWDTDGEINAEYWHASQRILSTAISLTLQGTDFLLKSFIANESPFLLIAGGPNEWPHNCDKRDLSFSDFKTIDSQELIRAYNTVSIRKLSDSFIKRHENLRRVRNMIMHTVSKQIKITAKDVLLSVLEVNQELGKPGAWIEIRRQFLEREPTSIAYSPEHVTYVLSCEINETIEILTSAETIRYFNFCKRQRRYYCVNCCKETEDYDEQPKLAQLRPNQPNSTNLYCILCGQNRKVIRKDCNDINCNGNVIDEESNECLTCNCSQ